MMATGIRATVLCVLAASSAPCLSTGTAALTVGLRGQDSAQAGVQATTPSRIRTEIDTTRATVGDRIVVTVTVDHPRGTRVAWPDSIDMSPFEVVAAQRTPPVETPAGLRSGARFLVTAFELGELEIPSIDVRVVAADGGTSTETLSTDRFGVEIVSVGTDESGDIRDIRGPLSIPVSAVRIALWMLIGALGAAMAYWLWRRTRRASGSVAPARLEVEPALPPHERALAALDALEASRLLERGLVKDYHIQVSAILRRYVEERFGVEALELTTAEVVEGLARTEVDAGFQEGLRPFLEQCDLVKFAKVRPLPERCRDILALGRRLVMESAPVVETAEPEAA